MKKITLLAVVVATIATLSLQAATPAAPKKKAAIPADLLKKYDKNSDGKVDKNDNLTKEEMTAYKAELKKAQSAPAK